MLRNSIALMAWLSLTSATLGQTVVTFENATLAQPLPAPDSYQNGKTLSPPGSFTTSGATFNNNYNSTFDSWSGWSYSNIMNVTKPGFTNQYAAYNIPGGGSGDNSANYALAFGGATIDFAPGSRPSSARLTNTTYAALSMQNGDSFAKKFGGASGNDPDFFSVTFSGTNAAGDSTGAVQFALADFRFADNTQDYIVSQWTTVDFSSLAADTTRISLQFQSSDVGMFGINTPTYVGLDNLVLTPVPEPMGLIVLAAVGFGVWRRRI